VAGSPKPKHANKADLRRDWGAPRPLFSDLGYERRTLTQPTIVLTPLPQYGNQNSLMLSTDNSPHRTSL
jgi:hypothetical protein